MNKILAAGFLFAWVGVVSAQRDVPVGALLALTGDAAYEGLATRTALLLAERDVNVWLDQEGAEFRIRMMVEDTRTHPDTALEKLELLHARRVRAVLGPSTSAELSRIKPFADEHGILILSHASTAPSLSVAGDNIFRFVPDDTYQAQAIVEMMKERRVSVVVPVWRGDLYGDDLVNGVRSRARDVRWSEGVRYAVDDHDAEEIVAELRNQVLVWLEEEQKNVAVLLVSFDESESILAAASGVDELEKVAWYGTDGTARSGAIAANSETAGFAARTGFISPVHTYDHERGMMNAPLVAVRAQLGGHLGREPEPYAYAAWDALWVLSAALRSAGPDAPLDILKQTLIDTAEQFQGILGAGSLNEAGDRIFGKYGFYRLEQTEQGEYRWVREATCHIQPVFPPYVTRP